MCAPCISLRSRRAGRTTERGSVIATVGITVAMFMIGVLAVIRLTSGIVDRANAQAAADASALAGVADGREAAVALAATNGAALTRFVEGENEVTVEVVTSDGTRAIASAERQLSVNGTG